MHMDVNVASAAKYHDMGFMIGNNNAIYMAIQKDGLREAEESIQAMQKRGLKVIEPSPSQLDEWHLETAKAYPEIREMVDPSVFDRVDAILKAYRK